MREQNLVIFHFLCLLAFAIFLSAFQTSIWPEIAGSLPSPVFWLPLLIYYALYRRPLEGILFLYISAAFLCSFSSLTYGQFLLIMLLEYFLIRFIKSRIFWSGISYFALVSIGSVFFLQLIHLAAVSFFEDAPPPNLSWQHFLIEPLWAALLSRSYFRFFEVVDHWFDREPEYRAQDVAL